MSTVYGMAYPYYEVFVGGNTNIISTRIISRKTHPNAKGCRITEYTIEFLDSICPLNLLL